MRILKRLGDSQTAGFGLVQRFQQYFIFQYVSFGTGQRLSQNLAKEENLTTTYIAFGTEQVKTRTPL